MYPTTTEAPLLTVGILFLAASKPRKQGVEDCVTNPHSYFVTWKLET